MNVSLRALLLIGAIVLFVLAILLEEKTTLLALGLAAFAGAFLVDDLGIGRTRRR